MTVIERLQETLGALALTAVEGRLESLLEQAAKNEPSYGDFLLDVLSTEVEARRQRYLKTRLQLAHLPYVKTFEQLDFSFQPSIDERQARELRTLRFIHEVSNVIPAQRAPRARRTWRWRWPKRRSGLDRQMRIYLAPKVLIIDEMGYLPLDDLGATIFFQLVSARYEPGSIILTSNKSYGDWGSIFGDPIIATAILDRLLHHSTTVNIRGESYRLKDRRRAGLLTRPEDQQPAATALAGAPNDPRRGKERK